MGARPLARRRGVPQVGGPGGQVQAPGGSPPGSGLAGRPGNSPGDGTRLGSSPAMRIQVYLLREER